MRSPFSITSQLAVATLAVWSLTAAPSAEAAFPSRRMERVPRGWPWSNPATSWSWGTSSSSSSNTLAVPSDDPFYNVPSDLSGKKPGTILATRQVDVAIAASHQQNLQGAYQISHVTENLDGSKTATITTVMVPHNAYANPQRVLVYSAVEDSAYIGCAPSYQMRMNSKIVSLPTLGEGIFMNQALAKGHIVVSTDYEGPNSIVGVGPSAAKMVLDGIRAALNFKTVFPDPKNTRIALQGYSGGAQATAWAVQEQPTYAPELSFVGAAIGGPVVNISSLLELNAAEPYTGTGDFMVVLAGSTDAYPAVSKFLKNSLNANGTAAVAKIRQMCLLDAWAAYKGLEVFSTFFKISAKKFYASKDLQKMFKENVLGRKGTNVPKVPLLVYHAVVDDTTPAADTDLWVKNMCDRGATSIRHLRDTQAAHSTLVFTGAGLALSFVEDLLAGKPAQKGCTTQNVQTSFGDAINWATFGGALIDAMKAAMWMPIGPAWNNQ